MINKYVNLSKGRTEKVLKAVGLNVKLPYTFKDMQKSGLWKKMTVIENGEEKTILADNFEQVLSYYEISYFGWIDSVGKHEHLGKETYKSIVGNCEEYEQIVFLGYKLLSKKEQKEIEAEFKK